VKFPRVRGPLNRTDPLSSKPIDHRDLDTRRLVAGYSFYYGNGNIRDNRVRLD
jgi:hypothetical protein